MRQLGLAGVVSPMGKNYVVFAWEKLVKRFCGKMGSLEKLDKAKWKKKLKTCDYDFKFDLEESVA